MDMQSVTPLDSPTMAQSVYEKVVDLIITGKLPPGSPITTSNLAKQFGVSLIPVREAVKMLEMANLITRLENRRLVIRELSKEDMQTLFEVRLRLECMAARRAVANSNQDTVRVLKNKLAEMKEAHSQREFIKLNREFHFILYRASNSAVLIDIIENLWLRFSPYFHLYAFRRSDFDAVNDFHQDILKGIKEKKANIVCRSLIEDMRHGLVFVKNMFEDNLS